MANWQERIRQILEEEKREGRREIARKAELKRQMIEEQETKRLHAARDKQLEEEARSRESFKILKELQIQELLEKVKQDVWHVGTVEFAYDSLKLGFDYESAEYPKIGSEGGGRDGGSHDVYGDKGHIVTRQTYLSISVSWRKKGPMLRILDSENSISSLHPYVETDPGGIYITDIKHPKSHQWIEELLLEGCVNRTKKNCLPLDLKAQGKKEIERIVPWHNRVFRKRE